MNPNWRCHGSQFRLLIVGIGGTVLGVDPSTGNEVWRRKPKGGDYVTISAVGHRIFAGAKGQLFCLDPADGKLLRHNQLKGMGTGIVSFASNSDVVAVEAHQAEEAARVASAIVAI
jgi:outer membrane protein assembly factor BamB